MKEEVFKPIEGYEGLYEISNQGRVKSNSKTWISANGSRRSKSETIKGTSKSGDYIIVLLCKDGKSVAKYVHRLVAAHFCENICNLEEVNHKNGNKADNYFENLEWVTPKKNVEHSFEIGLRVAMKGSQCAQAKLVEADVIKIRNLVASGVKQKDVAIQFGIKFGSVSDVITRKTWKHV